MTCAAAVARAFREACHAELAAPKPGNVHLYAPGHGMTVSDFVASAEAAAGPLSAAGRRVGARISAAIEATAAAVGSNTNLGIVLLCAPLAAAAERPGRRLREGVEAVLAGLDRQDAADAFAAIVLACPAGLGRVEAFDVRESPECTLREAMAAAADRDRIARAYTDGFADIFGLGSDALAAARLEGRADWWPATAVYFAYLAGFADSHIVRKCGPIAAEEVRSEAAKIFDSLTATADEDSRLAMLLKFDRSLKRRQLNPGTSADLCVATLFADLLRDILR